MLLIVSFVLLMYWVDSATPPRVKSNGAPLDFFCRTVPMLLYYHKKKDKLPPSERNNKNKDLYERCRTE